MVLVECLDRSLNLLAVPAVLLVVPEVLFVAFDGHLVLALTLLVNLQDAVRAVRSLRGCVLASG